MKKTLITSLALTSLAAGLSAQTSIPAGDITTPTTWSGEVVLEGAVFVKNTTLTIQPGTIVRGQPRTLAVTPGNPAGTPGALIVTQTGRLIADGTANNPIIFTTAAVDNDSDGNPDDADSSGFLDAWTSGGTFYDDAPKTAPLAPLNADGNANVQLWGGLVILGNAPTNLANYAGVGYGKQTVEGLTVPGFPAADATYGGVNPHDNSGVLRYLSIRYAGDEIGNANELNGISLGGVGDGTIVENIEVYCNFDDGIEWFGGTVNGKNLAVFFVGDDMYDLDEGYTGTNQFLFGIMPFFNNTDGTDYGSSSGDKASEFDGDNFRADGGQVDNANVRIDNILAEIDGTAWPLSYPSMWNMTLIGSSPAAGDFDPSASTMGFPSTNRGIQFRNGFAGEVYNSLIANTGGETAFEVATDVEKGVQVDVDGDTVFDFDGDVIDNANAGLVSVVATSSFDGAALGANELVATSNGDALAAKLGFASAVNRTNTVGPFAFSFTNGDVTFDPQGDANGKLDASLKTAKIDPRPLGLGASLGVNSNAAQGLDAVSFRGAFAPTAATLWTTGWTAMNVGGLLAD